ncbi:MAG: signal recognition particle protein [Chloroflexota bacterium]|nr:MAG: signal recognition particle protein [Chloroflexota bacterium]
MFDSLSERLQDVFERLRGRGRLSESDVDEALKEVRRALLAADVNFAVTRRFVDRIRERSVGEDILHGLNPAQQVIKIVHEELIAVLGAPGRLDLDASPAIIMLVGLQGTGKTTLAGKLAMHLRKTGSRPLLVAADLQRPAAIEQLQTLGRQIDVPVYSEPTGDPATICQRGVAHGRQNGHTVVILDTAGRLHVDEPLMGELARIRDTSRPGEVLLVVDAMTGQEAVRVAEEFHKGISLTGLVLTKVDGDARGGAALSIREVTGVPIKFLGTGEKLDAIEQFHPERLASRVLGMGDVLTLIERAQETFDQSQTEQLQKKIQRATFDLDDFLKQLQQLRKMGPLSQILGMIPGFNQATKGLPKEALEGDQMKRVEAIIQSMTSRERTDPSIIDGSRRRRIARGSGTTPQDVNQLLNQFQQARTMMKQFTSGHGPLGRMAGAMPVAAGAGRLVPTPARKKDRKKKHRRH